MALNLHHGRPATRRQFLACGLTGFSAMVAGWATRNHRAWLGSPSAWAADLPGRLVPFLVFDLAGGAALPGNFLVGGPGGPEDLLKSYDTLGWDPRQASALDSRFGLPMAGQNVSQILAGMLEVMSPKTQANLRLASVLHLAQDDTDSNALSLLTLVSKAGLQGTTVPSALGSVVTASGGQSASVLKDAVYQPLSVLSIDDLLEANGLGPWLERLGLTSRLSLVSAMNQLAKFQAAKYQALDSGPKLIERVSEAFGGLDMAIRPQTGLDPRQDPVSRGVYGINPDSDKGSQDVVFGGIVHAVLTGRSGPGVLTIGNCDYHDGTQTSGDTKDKEIGKEVGRAVELASRLGSPLFFQLITDGGIYSGKGTRLWIGDAGNRSMSVMGYYRPDQAAAYRSRPGGVQVGSYIQGQTADVDTLVGGNPTLAAHAVFANYLQVCGRIADFGTLTNQVFNAKELDSVLVFA